MRVLVAGAGGVAGRSLVPLLRGDFDVVGLDRPEVSAIENVDWIVADIRDWRQLRPALRSHEHFDALVDLIMAPVAAVGPEDRARSELDVNVAGTWTLLTEAFEVGVRRLVYMSTLNVYGDMGQGEHVEEDDLLRNQTRDGAEPYGLSKRIAEQLCAYFCATRGATGIAFRLDSLHVPGVMERRGIHIEDIAAATSLALTAVLEGFTICNLTADPARNNGPNDRVRALLDWSPRHVFTLRRDLEDWTQPVTPKLGSLRDGSM